MIDILIANSGYVFSILFFLFFVGFLQMDLGVGIIMAALPLLFFGFVNGINVGTIATLVGLVITLLVIYALKTIIPMMNNK